MRRLVVNDGVRFGFFNVPVSVASCADVFSKRSDSDLDNGDVVWSCWAIESDMILVMN